MYVDKIMSELKPKFSLIPETPYKVTVYLDLGHCWSDKQSNCRAGSKIMEK